MAVGAVVAAAEFNASDFLKLYKANEFEAVIAADAGYSHLQKLSVLPTVVIGDFDSLGYVPDQVTVQQHPAKKDETDLELALQWAVGHSCQTVRIYGALGGRLDHTLANLQIGACYSEKGIDVVFVSDDAVVKILSGPASYDLPLCTSGTVSVLSASDRVSGVVETGLEYAFTNEVITNRITRGVSNELVGKPASVSVDSGTLYVIHPLG